MELHRNYKYRLYPTKTQADLLDYHIFISKQAWNSTLALKIKDLKKNSHLDPQDRKYMKDSEIETLMKLELQSRGLKFHSGIVQESFKSMKKTLELFYKKRKTSDNIGFPKFQSSKSIEGSFFFKNQGISWTDSYFKILKNKIKWKYHRKLPNDNINSVVIKRESDGKYYIILNVSFENKIKQKTPKKPLECGIDMNVKNISISDSNGHQKLIKIEDFNKNKYSKTYRKLQQQLSKRYKSKNFSKNTKRLQKKSNKMFRKIKNKKEDFFHKLSNELTNNFDRITIEKLEIKSMKESESTRLNRLISDVSWNSLIQKIKYKSEMKHKIIREINPAYTSIRCSKCGFIHKNNRKSQSDFSCLKCKYTTNADINASQNILDIDKWSLEQKALISSWNQNLCAKNDNSFCSLAINGGSTTILRSPTL